MYRPFKFNYANTDYITIVGIEINDETKDTLFNTKFQGCNAMPWMELSDARFPLKEIIKKQSGIDVKDLAPVSIVPGTMKAFFGIFEFNGITDGQFLEVKGDCIKLGGKVVSQASATPTEPEPIPVVVAESPTPEPVKPEPAPLVPEPVPAEPEPTVVVEEQKVSESEVNNESVDKALDEELLDTFTVLDEDLIKDESQKPGTDEVYEALTEDLGMDGALANMLIEEGQSSDEEVPELYNPDDVAVPQEVLQALSQQTPTMLTRHAVDINETIKAVAEAESEFKKVTITEEIPESDDLNETINVSQESSTSTVVTQHAEDIGRVITDAAEAEEAFKKSITLTGEVPEFEHEVKADTSQEEFKKAITMQGEVPEFEHTATLPKPGLSSPVMTGVERLAALKKTKSAESKVAPEEKKVVEQSIVEEKEIVQEVSTPEPAHRVVQSKPQTIDYEAAPKNVSLTSVEWNTGLLYKKKVEAEVREKVILGSESAPSGLTVSDEVKPVQPEIGIRSKKLEIQNLHTERNESGYNKRPDDAHSEPIEEPVFEDKKSELEHSFEESASTDIGKKWDQSVQQVQRAVGIHSPVVKYRLPTYESATEEKVEEAVTPERNPEVLTPNVDIKIPNSEPESTPVVYEPVRNDIAPGTKEAFIADLPHEIGKVIGDIPTSIIGNITEFTMKDVDLMALANKGEMYCIEKHWVRSGKWYCIDVVNRKARHFYNKSLGVSIEIPVSILKQWRQIIGG